MRNILFLIIIKITFIFSIQSQSILVPKSSIIAHRGYWNISNSTENSLSSLKNASESGFYGSEFDVRQTKDGVLIVYHDEKYSGFNISETNYEDLSRTLLSNGENLPTLKSYLIEGSKSNENFKMVLDIKSGDISSIIKLVDSLKMTNKVEYISFSYNYCMQIIKMDRKFKVLYLSGNIPPDSLYKNGFAGFSYSYDIIDKNQSWIKRAKELNLVTSVWTINSIQNIQKYYQMGIDLISTDTPFFTHEPKISINNDTLDIISNNDLEYIYYTTDNSDPNIYGKLFIKKILLNEDSVVKAIAKRVNFFNSNIVSFNFYKVHNINELNQRSIITTKYYSLEGKETLLPSNGIQIIKTFYDDGSIIVKKIIVQ